MEVLLPLGIIFSVLLVFVTAVTFTAIGGEDLGYVMSEFNKDPLIFPLLGPAMGYVFISISIYLMSLFVAAYAMTAVLRAAVFPSLYFSHTDCDRTFRI